MIRPRQRRNIEHMLDARFKHLYLAKV